MVPGRISGQALGDDGQEKGADEDRGFFYVREYFSSRTLAFSTCRVNFMCPNSSASPAHDGQSHLLARLAVMRYFVT